MVKLGQLLGLLSSMVSTSDKRKKTGDTTFTNYFVSGESESVLVLVLKLRSCLPLSEIAIQLVSVLKVVLAICSQP